MTAEEFLAKGDFSPSRFIIGICRTSSHINNTPAATTAVDEGAKLAVLLSRYRQIVTESDSTACIALNCAVGRKSTLPIGFKNRQHKLLRRCLDAIPGDRRVELFIRGFDGLSTRDDSWKEFLESCLPKFLPDRMEIVFQLPPQGKGTTPVPSSPELSLSLSTSITAINGLGKILKVEAIRLYGALLHKYGSMAQH